MAGIIVSLGNGTSSKFEEIRKNFEILKGLKTSGIFKSNTCNIAKYKRKIDVTDSNWFETSKVVVCAVGTVLFREYGLDDSIHEIGKALCKDFNISQITDDIDGHFCLVVIDKKQKKCNIISDAGGVINTYIIRNEDNIYISTSMLALAKVFLVTSNQMSILMFLRSGWFFNDTTYFNEIELLKPASLYCYDFKNSQFKRSEYWAVPKDVNERISFEDAAHQITESLNNILARIPNNEAIYDLTGGYDARFILSLVYRKERYKDYINTFFFGPLHSREAKIVEENCKNLGLQYHNYGLPNNWLDTYFDYVLRCHNLCDGMESATAYAPILFAQEKKAKIFQYSINGLYGELYRQRTWEFEFGGRGKRRPAHLMRFIRYRDLAGDFDSSIFSEKSSREISEVPNIILEIYKKTNRILGENAPNTLQVENVFFAQRRGRWGRNVTSSNQIIHSISPLWFKKPLETTFSLRPEYKKRCALMKYIAEKESPDLAKEKMITGTPFMMMNIKTVHRFIPGVDFVLRKAIRKLSQILFNKTIWEGLTTPDYNKGEWYRKALQDPRCQELLDWNKMISRKFYDKQRFEGFIERAKTENFHFYGQLGNIITVELTLRAAKLADEVGN